MRNNPLRKLARSPEWQSRYRIAKELNVPFFKNEKELSSFQVLFLNWLATYEVLYQDLCLNEQYMSEKVINDDYLCDAYLYWKRNKKDERENNNMNGELSASKVVTKRISFDAKLRK